MQICGGAVRVEVMVLPKSGDCRSEEVVVVEDAVVLKIS